MLLDIGNRAMMPEQCTFTMYTVACTTFFLSYGAIPIGFQIANKKNKKAL
jgi:hypothetical protein